MNRKDILKRIKLYSHKSKTEIRLLILVKMLFIPVTLISPYFIKLIIDNVIYNAQTGVFLYVISGLMAVFVIRFILDFITVNCTNKILNKTSYFIRYDIWKKYLQMSHCEFEKRNIGDLKMILLDDVDSLGNFVNEQMVVYFFYIIIAICSFALCLFTNAKITLICSGIFPIVFFTNNLIGKGFKNVNEQIRETNKEYFAFEHSSFEYWHEIKAQNIENDIINRFKYYRKSLAKLGYKWILYWVFTEIFTDIKFNYLTKVLVYSVGAVSVLNGNLTMGLLVMISEYFSLLFTSLDTLNNKQVDLKINVPYYRRIFKLLDLPAEEKRTVKANLNTNMILDNVSFKYPESSEYVLRNINLKINKGEYISVMGKSGCGKTTLIKLILNLYNPDIGVIRINGIDMGLIDKNCLYSQIGAVMQDLYFFNLSIKDNLLIANRNADSGDLEKACKKANIHEFISGLPEGYDTIIGERGGKLSGGQKQRLAIARIFLKNPKLIIFDEATSSIDRKSEDIINDSIRNIYGEVMIIVISHKSSEILKPDQVFEIDK